MNLKTRFVPMRRLCLLCLILLTGCGGGNRLGTNRSATGRATFTVLWPAAGRLIPAAANSIVVQIQQGKTVIATQTLARPAAGGPATAMFATLPTGAFTAMATAYPTNNGSGVAQAQAAVPLTIQANQNTPFSLTMASTIDHLELASPNPSVTVGQTVSLTATAKDASGNIVLLTPSKLQWSSSSGAASVAGGAVIGLAPGSATISVTEQESGKSAAVTVTVAIPTGSVPVVVTGFNLDVVFENQSTTSAATFDDGTFTWIEDGLGGYSGLPTGVFTSRLTNPVTQGSTQYQLQPFTGNNALFLTPANAQGTLTLTTPAHFRAISIAAASSNARFVPGVGTLTLNFADGTTAGPINYNARDWWGEGTNDDPNRILTNGAHRTDNIGATLPLTSVQVETFYVNFNLYETTIDLSTVGGVDDTHKNLQSITFNLASGAGHTAIFAVSGVFAP